LDDPPDSEVFNLSKEILHVKEITKIKIDEIKSIASTSRELRAGLKKWIGSELQFTGFIGISTGLAIPSIKFGELGFMKKSNDRIFHLVRVAALNRIAEGRIPAFAPEVMAEIQALIDKYDQSPDWRA
jgi:hypothetical protein